MHTKTAGSMKINDEAAGEVSAVFATLGVVDAHGDVTRKGAFSPEDVLISAYGHETWKGAMPVGRGSIREVGDEAIFTGKFFMDTTAGRDTFHTVKATGELQEWSYGFDILESDKGEVEGKQVQYLDKLKVYEVSPVLIGAGKNTRTLAVKDGMKFEQHIEAVVADVDALLTRAESVVTLRAEKGKAMGEDSATALAGLDAALTRLTGLLKSDEADHDNIDADAVAQELARFERHRSQLIGA